MAIYYNESEAIAAQKEFCKKNELPHFAPYDGYCFRCGHQIYGENGIPVEKAKSTLVTGCPYCGTSYCD